MQGGQQSGGGKAALPPHALALYQQQITMAHGESSQEVKQQQQQLSVQPGKQQAYNSQAERDREALHSSSPRVRPRSPSISDKDGTRSSVLTQNHVRRSHIRVVTSRRVRLRSSKAAAAQVSVFFSR